MSSSNTKAMELYNQAGEKYFAGLWEESKSLLEEAIKLDPTFAIAHRNLGIIHHDLGNAHAAAEYINKALELGDIETSELYRMVGDSFFMIGNNKQAINFLTKAINLDENNYLARFWLAQCYIKAGRRATDLSEDSYYKGLAKEEADRIRETYPDLAQSIDYRL